MKLKLSGTGTGFGKIRDAETNHLVASGVRHIDAREIIRRVNSFDALVQSCEIALTLIEGTMTHQTAENTANYIRAALALAAASETRTKGTPDAKTGTQGGE